MRHQRWRKTLLPLHSDLRAAIRCLNDSALQIVLVVDAQEVLQGTLTDGDIRRGLLRGLSLDSPVQEVLQRQPLVVPPRMGKQAVLQLMQANRLHQLPVVDEQRRVTGLHLWDELLVPAKRANPMVIMAGGRGVRLMPHTEHCPKPLLPVGGRPILEHIIERAKADGFEHFVLSVHYLAHMIEDHFGDGSRFGVRIDYLHEPHPMGTAGALALLQPRPEQPFIVSNGDVLTDVRYAEMLDFHLRHQALATMAVQLHEWQHPFGVVKTRGVDIVGFEEKPVMRSHVNAGIYVLQPQALDALAVSEPCDMPTLFARLQEQAARTIVYPMHEPWLDVGRPDDLQRARSEKAA